MRVTPRRHRFPVSVRPGRVARFAAKASRQGRSAILILAVLAAVVIVIPMSPRPGPERSRRVQRETRVSRCSGQNHGSSVVDNHYVHRGDVARRNRSLRFSGGAAHRQVGSAPKAADLQVQANGGERPTSPHRPRHNTEQRKYMPQRHPRRRLRTRPASGRAGRHQPQADPCAARLNGLCHQLLMLVGDYGAVRYQQISVIDARQLLIDAISRKPNGHVLHGRRARRR